MGGLFCLSTTREYGRADKDKICRKTKTTQKAIQIN